MGGLQRDSDAGPFWALTSYFNPMRYRRRRANYRAFRERLNVPLVAVELANGAGFELTEEDADVLIQLRDGDVMWQKERLLNVALGALPASCRKVVWVDCDIVFAAEDWAERVSALLERFMLVQAFSHVDHLSADGEVVCTQPSAALAIESGMRGSNQFGRPTLHGPGSTNNGLAWAARRELLDEAGFYDTCIVGGGDTAMVAAAHGSFDVATRSMSERQVDHYLDWARSYHDMVGGEIELRRRRGVPPLARRLREPALSRAPRWAQALRVRSPRRHRAYGRWRLALEHGQAGPARAREELLRLTERGRMTRRADAGPPRELGRLLELARRAMLRTGAGPLRPAWRLAYRAAARGVSAYLRAGNRAASVYAVGNLGGPDMVYGSSDVDLAVVVPAAPGRPGVARDAMEQRWDRLWRMAPPLRLLVFVAVYEDQELQRAATRSPFLPTGRPFGPGPLVDDLNVASRPMHEPPARAWHRLAGPRRLPAAPEPDIQMRGRIAWLELQHWWRYAFDASVTTGPQTPYLCVKLASEPARIWLWLVHGERVPSRTEALRQGIEALPEERETFERALALHRALPRSPDPPLAQTLEAFLRLTGRIAHRLEEEVEAEGFEEVRLSWAEDDLGAGLLPLADWRALVWPAAADEALVEMPGHPADPATLEAATMAGRAGAYPALRHDDLLVLPAQPHGRTLLRAVQSPLTDPVSFAVLDGSPVAHFSRAAGWSIEETARRAVAEHRARLEAGGEKLGLLFAAARAGLLLESVESSEPELALTVAAVARSVGAESAYQAYLESRSGGRSRSARVVADLRRCVLTLPGYRDPAAVPPDWRLAGPPA